MSTGLERCGLRKYELVCITDAFCEEIEVLPLRVKKQA